MYACLGPFFFSIPTFSVEAIRRNVESRVSPQNVIGAKPITHLLGPGQETISFTSTFYPFHMNKGGVAMLEGVKAACRAQVPLMLVVATGFVFGRWVITTVGEVQSEIGIGGIPQKHEVEMTLTEYIDHGSYGGVIF